MDNIEKIIGDLKNVVLYITGILVLAILVFCTQLAVTGRIDIERPELIKGGTEVLQDLKAKEIKNYDDLVTAMQKHQTSLYETIVVKTLMKLFDSLLPTVLTFIFGVKALQFVREYSLERLKLKSK